MINTDKYNVEHESFLGRILPYYIRGQMMTRILLGIFHPINTVHEAWKAWALERKIEANITSQKMSLAWYLKHLFYPRLVNKDAEFIISQGLDVPENVLFSTDQVMEANAYSAPCYCEGEGKSNITMVLRNPHEVPEKCTVFTIVPPIIEETTDYNNTDYRHDIERAVDKYTTVFNKYQIQI